MKCRVTLKYGRCRPQIVSLHVLYLQEFRQHSAEWEQQRVQYQRQVASLEAQRKTLAEQFTKMQVVVKMNKALTERIYFQYKL